jgi:hypothetical protein
MSVFHGWRRQTGWIAFALACFLLSAWLRSWIVHDKVSCCINGIQYHYHSVGGGFRRQEHELRIRDVNDPTFMAWLTPENQWVTTLIQPGELPGVDFHYLPMAEMMLFLSAHLIFWPSKPPANQAEFLLSSPI